MVEIERYYAECQECCSAFSSPDEIRASDWADQHEYENDKHNVKIGLESISTDPRDYW